MFETFEPGEYSYEELSPLFESISGREFHMSVIYWSPRDCNKQGTTKVEFWSSSEYLAGETFGVYLSDRASYSVQRVGNCRLYSLYEEDGAFLKAVALAPTTQGESN